MSLDVSLGLGEGEEFRAIRAMVERWGPLARGIGDDAAITSVPRGDQLVVSTDASIEGRHFRREWLTPQEIGYRSVAAALSDLAAMAARPIGVLVALAVPASWRDAMPGIADGIGEAVAAARTVVLGGNLSDASELSIVTTVLGSAYEPLRRSGARSGDGVYVTGTLGGPGRAIAALAAGREADVPARASFAHPTPRIREALWLADRGASAAIDISDGLAADLAHLAAASEVTIDIDVERIQTIDGADWRNALASGEEYELVVTSPRELDCGEFARVFGLPLTRIGVVTAGDSASSVVLRANGERVANPPGHDHFS